MNFDCQACGACCRPPVDEPDWVTLTPIDVERLTLAEREHVQPRATPSPYAGDIRTVRRHDGCACCFLAGTIGRVASCLIYPRRPDGCRQFEAGSPECLAARESAGVVQ